MWSSWIATFSVRASGYNEAGRMAQCKYVADHPVSSLLLCSPPSWSLRFALGRGDPWGMSRTAIHRALAAESSGVASFLTMLVISRLPNISSPAPVVEPIILSLCATRLVLEDIQRKVSTHNWVWTSFHGSENCPLFMAHDLTPRKVLQRLSSIGLLQRHLPLAPESQLSHPTRASLCLVYWYWRPVCVYIYICCEVIIWAKFGHFRCYYLGQVGVSIWAKVVFSLYL